MPNWVINRLTLEGENAEKILKKHITEDENGGICFDFNTITPRPEDLNIEKGSRSADGLKLYIAKINPLIFTFGDKEDKMLPIESFLKKMVSLIGQDCIDKIEKYILKPKEIEELKLKYKDEFDDVVSLGKKAFTNLEKYGFTDWYEWSYENWGTKWNACNSFVVGGNVVCFDTAWGPSVPVIEKFANMYPELKITHEYAEEQVALFCGKHEYENGEIVSKEDYKEFSKEAYELYFDLWGCEDEYVFDKKKNTYVYKETESVMC